METVRIEDSITCSVVITTYDKSESLNIVLESIFSQKVSFPYEVLVVKDGPSEKTVDVCDKFAVKLIDSGNTSYRNPARARNIGYKAAKGEVLICQCDDVVHVSKDVIERLTCELQHGEFLLSKTENWHYVNSQPNRYIGDYCSVDKRQAPFFFCGSILRKDLYAVGGNDDDFVEPEYDDNWFADCIMNGLGLKPRYSTDIITHHISHGYPSNSHVNRLTSQRLYISKVEEAKRTGVWQSSGGPWPC